MIVTKILVLRKGLCCRNMLTPDENLAKDRIVLDVRNMLSTPVVRKVRGKDTVRTEEKMFWKC